MDFNKIINYAVECVTKNYANFNGRARRAEYWSYTLCTTIISLVIGGLYQATGSSVFNILISQYFYTEERRFHGRKTSEIYHHGRR